MANVKCDHCGQPLGEWAGSSPCCGSTVSLIEEGKSDIQAFVAESAAKVGEVAADFAHKNEFLVTKRQVIGTIAKNAIKAAPLQLPFDLQTTLLNILHEITGAWQPFSQSFPAMWFSPTSLREFLEKHCYAVAEFKNWNLRPSEQRAGVKYDDPRPHSFVSSHDLYEEYRDNDFIDLDALIRNVVNDIVSEETERRQSDEHISDVPAEEMKPCALRSFRYMDMDIQILITGSKGDSDQTFEDVLEQILVEPVFKVASPDTEFSVVSLNAVGAEAKGLPVTFHCNTTEEHCRIEKDGVLFIYEDAQWCRVTDVVVQGDILHVTICPMQKYYAIKVRAGKKMHYKKFGN